MNFPVYLDNHSTTKVDPEVLKSMLPWFDQRFGNASSKSHSYGWFSEEAVTQARENIAASINSNPEEIIFTSGTTESNNFALKGIAESYGQKRKHIISTLIEHPSVLETLSFLERKGFEITYLPVNNLGNIDLNQLSDSIRQNTLLVSVMTANNEIGNIYPIAEIGAICREKGILLHTDAAQAIGKMHIDVKTMNIDLLSFSAHKNYGPKGIGALYFNKERKIKLTPMFLGGGQEFNLRSGTLNVPGIVGLEKSICKSYELIDTESKRIRFLRDKLFNGISSQINGVYLNGDPENRLYNNLNISIENINIDNLLMEVRELAFSTGSACASSNSKPSHVYWQLV